MAKNISVSDEVYRLLKERKGDKSFGVYIGESVGGMSEKAEQIAILMAKVAKLEEFVSTKSGGQYELL